MQIFFNTVIRSAPPKESGELVLLDWDNKAVVKRLPIFASDPDIDDPNPRGNSRGGRGIALVDDQVLASTYHTLKIYDRALVHQRDLSHPLLVGLHECHVAEDGGLWTTATSIDSALKIDLSSGELTGEFWPREMAGIQQRFDVSPLSIDKQADNRIKFLSSKFTRDGSHLHLNAVATWEGEVYALFNRFGAIVNLSRDEVVVEDPALKGGHNLMIMEDGVAIANGTISRTVRFWNLGSKELVQSIDLMQYKPVQMLARGHDVKYAVQRTLNRLNLLSAPAARALFVRGLDRWEDTLFIGVSPASILCVDWKKNRLVDLYTYSSDLHVCIHGLRVTK